MFILEQLYALEQLFALGQLYALGQLFALEQLFAYEFSSRANTRFAPTLAFGIITFALNLTAMPGAPSILFLPNSPNPVTKKKPARIFHQHIEK